MILSCGSKEQQPLEIYHRYPVPYKPQGEYQAFVVKNIDSDSVSSLSYLNNIRTVLDTSLLRLYDTMHMSKMGMEGKLHVSMYPYSDCTLDSKWDLGKDLAFRCDVESIYGASIEPYGKDSLVIYYVPGISVHNPLIRQHKRYYPLKR
ncbi:MAG: hypothetical protein RL757_71 [Bacteroidota bacterium]|jgi:hypothetical protein